MRKRIDFWLDDTKSSDVKLWKLIQKMRSKRTFSQNVKDGILIMNQLMAGKTDLLFAKFPWIVDKILASAPPKPNDSGDLEDRLAARVEASVTAAMMNMPSLPATPLVGAPIKPSAAPPKAESKAVAPVDASTIADNFFASLG